MWDLVWLTAHIPGLPVLTTQGNVNGNELWPYGRRSVTGLCWLQATLALFSLSIRLVNFTACHDKCKTYDTVSTKVTAASTICWAELCDKTTDIIILVTHNVSGYAKHSSLVNAINMHTANTLYNITMTAHRKMPIKAHHIGTYIRRQGLTCWWFTTYTAQRRVWQITDHFTDECLQAFNCTHTDNHSQQSTKYHM